MATETIPMTMRALLYDQSTQTFRLTNSYPVPKADFEKGEHLLKVHYTAITKGELTWPVPTEMRKDYSPGAEMSGVVVACPPHSKFRVGSQVYMRTAFPRSASTREYTIGLEHELAFLPTNTTAEQAASVPMSALTAWQALFVQTGYTPTFSEPQPNQPLEHRKRILITGASGSVGLWATQLARLAGFHVTGTCHTRNTNTLLALGAHEVIDYTTTSLTQWLETTTSKGIFDLVLDCVTDGTSPDIWTAAHPSHGQVITIVPHKSMNFKWILDRPDGISPDVTGRFFIMESNGEQLQKITELIDSGRLKPVVDSVYEFEDVEKAFDRVENGKTTGKVVVRVNRDDHQYITPAL